MSTSLSGKEIQVVVGELSDMVVGGRVEDCFQFDRKKLMLSVEKNDYTHNILITLQPPCTRLHATRMKLRKLKKRLPFGECVKKKLLGFRLVGLSQVDSDRIVRIDFENSSRYSLLIELFPRGGGVYLVGGDELVEASLTGARLGMRYTHSPTLQRDDPEVEVPHGKLLNLILDDTYREIEERQEFEDGKSRLLEHLRRKKKKAERLLTNLQRDHQKCLGWEQANLHGELLKANLGTLKKNSSSVKVLNYYTNEEIEISLDPTISPLANMEKFFKSAKKLRRGLAVIEHNRERAQGRLAPIDEQISAIEKMESPEQLDEYVSKNKIRVPVPRAKSKVEKKPASPFRYFLSKTGRRMYVGRSNEENDKLTISFGKGGDFWCHADGYPGSHVLVPLPKNTQIDHETFLDAVNLALYYSKAKPSGAGDVAYTERRYVSKTKGMPAGKVNVSKHKVLHVKLDEERIRGIRERTREESE